MKKEKPENLDTVHTHTHTSNLKNKKIIISTIVVLLILLVVVGILVVNINKSGLLGTMQESRKADVESDMKAKLISEITKLKDEKNGKATLDDITQNWIDSKITEYKNKIINDASISGKKVIMESSGIRGKFILDEYLNVSEITSDSSIEFSYEALKRKEGNKVYIIIYAEDRVNGISQIEYPDGHTVRANKIEKLAIDYEVELGTEYIFKVTSGSGEEKQERILLENYYYTITKNLGEGISLDNLAIKTAYNKPYKAQITATGDNVINSIEVTMGGQAVAVDATTGEINIGQVTGDIVITVTSRKAEIIETEPIIGTTPTATESVEDNSQTINTTLYINFTATLEGTDCTIVSKEGNNSLPYAITTNGKYYFIATGTYNGITITKEILITVNKYKYATGVVQYDAGVWTQEEIDALTTAKLYDYNESRSINQTAKVLSDSGLNLTFGGFKAGDSRNSSINPQSGYGTVQYDGWQILTSTQESGRTYVTKICHAGAPENFVFKQWREDNGVLGIRAEKAVYVLSGGKKYQSCNQLYYYKYYNVNPRTWDMYKDNSQIDLINNVHLMEYYESNNIQLAIRKTGAYYWIADMGFNVYQPHCVRSNGNFWESEDDGKILNYGCFRDTSGC